MSELVGRDDKDLSKVELSELGRSSRASSRRINPCFRGNSGLDNGGDDNLEENRVLLWAAIERLPTFRRIRSALFDETDGNNVDGDRKRVIDVTQLGAMEKKKFIEKLLGHIEHDNLQLLQKIRKRIDDAGVELSTVEVRYNNLSVEAKFEVVNGKPLPTLWNSFKRMLQDIAMVPGLESQESKICIVSSVSGILKPGRMTLLLGPPGCGKTSFLKALSGNLDKSQVNGEISYNGYRLTEFVPQKTAAYISQFDMHTSEMTVRETLDFSSRCQGVGSRAAIMSEVSRREKEAGILPDTDIDTYMKAISVEGQKATLQTDYILKILGLDVCANTLVGDAMRRSISGGQKKRLTTGKEMIVGPTRALFMDEISNGLDSSTAYQMAAYFQQLVHVTKATILVSLLQPSPETFDLFDDIILMGEGKVVYHGPRTSILEFFESCGFRCPERKGVADFLQEVISRKDQAQYWYHHEEPYVYNSVDMLSRKFNYSCNGRKLTEELSGAFLRSNSQSDAIGFTRYSVPKWELFSACMSKELLLMKRNSFLHIFKAVQLLIVASVTMTVFPQTRMGVDFLHANYYLGAMFYSLLTILVDASVELQMTVARLPTFYKQRDSYFFPAWAYAIPCVMLKVPISLLEAVVWTSLIYYGIGYTPEAGRFFRHIMLLFSLHFALVSAFCFIASVCRAPIASTAVASIYVFFITVFGGFIVARPSMPLWLKWGFWSSPLTYGEIALTSNEFLAPRWHKVLATNMTMGRAILESRGLSFDGQFFWISVGILFGFALFYNIGFILALSFLKPPVDRAIISSEKLSQMQGSHESVGVATRNGSKSSSVSTNSNSYKGKMVLPFEPQTMVFQDLQYYIETPRGMKKHGFTENKVQLLCDITGALRPGVLMALMGVTGAGKTTLLDVLAGRKTTGFVEGHIKIGGFPKVQKTFARISGYCEQTDIHSPQITVEESVIFSASLRLDPQIDSQTRYDFVKEVLKTIELDDIRDALVGIPGISGLSTEQRKRLTIAVELVANPAILFMDEPTTGLDARAAAIVMRAVKNVVDTGRTIVCTIHQPSIDIFESFDELILLKSGGCMIYSGPLGQQSCKVIKYFEAISGVPKIKDNYNPATWMLEVTSMSSEAELGVDFAEIYRSSTLYEDNIELVKRLSIPPPGAKVLDFSTQFSLNGWGQFKACLWKQFWSYWRSPSYNLVRFLHMLLTSLIFGVLLWGQGKKLNNQQDLFNIFGGMYIAAFFSGINNCSCVIPYVSTERTVLYRERFAGMYSSWAYALAQLAIEIPYNLSLALVYTIITYPMIGYYWSAYKVFWYFYSMFCTLLCFSNLGTLMISITPSIIMASVLQPFFYTLFNIFSGFIVPRPQIPNWWIWCYYLVPTSWTLRGMLTSQYGDIEKNIEVLGETKTVAKFLNDYFGFYHSQLPLVAVVLALYPIFFAILFAYCVGKLNFQKR